MSWDLIPFEVIERGGKHEQGRGEGRKNDSGSK